MLSSLCPMIDKSSIRNKRENRVCHAQRGFTLLEIVVTLIVLGIVSAVASKPLISLIQSRDSISAAASEQSDNDYSLARMATQIRLSQTTDIARCNDTELWIRSGNEAEAVATQYSLAGGEITSGAKVLVENVDNLAAGGEPLCQVIDSGLRLYRIGFRVDGEPFVVRAFKRSEGP